MSIMNCRYESNIERSKVQEALVLPDELARGPLS